MKRKLPSALLLTFIFLFFAVSTVYSQTYVNLSDFKNCNDVRFESNSNGSFMYGYNINTLYSSSVLPSLKTYYLNTDGKIRSVSHNESCSYALSEYNGNYTVMELNSTNGNYRRYDFGKMKSIDNDSFAFCGGKTYFIFTDSDYSYIKSFYSNGKMCQTYYFGKNVREVFSNNSKAYALLYNGDIYKINDNGTHYCISINTGYDFSNAGCGYVYSKAGTLFSLDNNSYENLSSAKFNCVVKSGRTLLYSDTKNVKLVNRIEKIYQTEKSISALFLHKDMAGILYEDFTYEKVDFSEFKKSDSAFSKNNTAVDTSVRINQDGCITGIESGTTVSSFKRLFSADIKVFNTDGNEVTSGKVKTGYRAEVDGVMYDIAVFGDITGEGNVKTNDTSLLMSYFTEKSSLSGVYLTAADYNNDGKVDNKDLVGIARYADK